MLWNPLVHALRVKLAIVTTRSFLCLKFVNLPCLKVNVHSIWLVNDADQTKILMWHALVQAGHRKGRGDTIVPQLVKDIIVKNEIE